MSSLTTPFMMPKVEEVIPNNSLLKDRVTSSSVVEERYTASQVPSSGDTYGVGGSATKLMIIRVANQNDYIDTSTMVLNFKAQALGAGDAAATPDVAIDDHIFSLVDTINVKVGGQTVEVLNNVGHLVNGLLQASMPIQYYKQNGGFEGCYIYNRWNDISGAVGVPALTNSSAAPDHTGSFALDARWVVGNRWLTNGRYYSVPLTLLGLCRLPTLFAARNFQDITLEILFKNSVNSACWQLNPIAASSTWANTPTNYIKISDVTLTYDCCRMSADYYALMDNELKMPNGSGVAYAIDTYQVQPASISAGSSVGAGAVAPAPYLTRIVVAKGTRFLKSVYGLTQPTVAESSPNWRNNSQHGNFSFGSYQVVINSKRYPQLQIQSSAAAFQELQKAYNQLGSIAAGNLLSWFTFVGQPFERLNNGAVVAGSRNIQDQVATSTKDGTSLGAFPSDEAMFQVGVNLEQFLTNQPDAGGINTSTSGYQIAVELAVNGYTGPYGGAAGATASTALTANALTHYVVLHFTRILTLKAGAVEILD